MTDKEALKVRMRIQAIMQKGLKDATGLYTDDKDACCIKTKNKEVTAMLNHLWEKDLIDHVDPTINK